MILTGAPTETLPFEEVDYWKELCELMDLCTEMMPILEQVYISVV